VSAAEVHVFTFKEGILARLAHDLRLSARRFEISRAGAELRGRFWVDSLMVDGVVRDGRLDPSSPSPDDRATIRRNIAAEILHTARYPTIDFEGRLEGESVVGSLTLVGKTCPVRAALRRERDRLRSEWTLIPSRWGIPPYKALAGAIRLQDRVVVVLDLPALPGGETTTPDPCTWTGS